MGVLLQINPVTEQLVNGYIIILTINHIVQYGVEILEF